MDRTWINAKRMSDEYINGVKEFLDFAERNANDESGMFYCPCVECLNQTRLSAEDIYLHLICEGFCKSYTLWIWHTFASVGANVFLIFYEKEKKVSSQ